MKPLRIKSLRAQLLLWLLIPVLLLGTLSSAAIYYMALDVSNDAYDQALADSARALESRLHFMRDNSIDIDLPKAAQAVLEYDNQDRFYYEIIGSKGRLIGGEHLFKHFPHSQKRLVFWNAVAHGSPVRVATLRVLVEHKTVTIHVAQTFVSRSKLQLEIFISVVLIQLLFILLSAGSIWLGVARGLIPLDRIRLSLSHRSQHDLRPLSEVGVPKEIQPLTHALNDLLQRLERDMLIQRRFIANAAHQLRTPLAGVKTQAEVTLRTELSQEARQSVQLMKTGIDRTIHLAQQLLSLTRSEQGVVDFSQFQNLDLVKIVRQVMRDIVPSALTKSIDLEYRGCEVPTFIHGDPISIQEMAFNLVENAVRYCRPNDRVIVSITTQAKAVELSVEDTGPGIPEAEREKVFERFYRVLGSHEDGSGLGLAIVKEIANTHEATIQLTSGKRNMGTRVLVRFKPIELS